MIRRYSIKYTFESFEEASTIQKYTVESRQCVNCVKCVYNKKIRTMLLHVFHQCRKQIEIGGGGG